MLSSFIIFLTHLFQNRLTTFWWTLKLFNRIKAVCVLSWINLILFENHTWFYDKNHIIGDRYSKKLDNDQHRPVYSRTVFILSSCILELKILINDNVFTKRSECNTNLDLESSTLLFNITDIGLSTMVFIATVSKGAIQTICWVITATHGHQQWLLGAQPSHY